MARRIGGRRKAMGERGMCCQGQRREERAAMSHWLRLPATDAGKTHNDDDDDLHGQAPFALTGTVARPMKETDRHTGGHRERKNVQTYTYRQSDE